MHRTDWSSSNARKLCSVRISAETSTNMRFIRDFPQSPNAHVGIVLQLGHDHFLSNYFQFTIHHSSSILSFIWLIIDGVWIGNRIGLSKQLVNTLNKSHYTTTSVLSHGLHCAAWQRLPKMDVLLLPGSRPSRPVAIRHQPPTLLTPVSGLSTRLGLTAKSDDRRSVASLSWCQVPIWGQLWVRWYGAPSLTRRQDLESGSHGTHNHILLSQIRDSPKLKGQVPVFISPRKRVAQLYHQKLVSLIAASYDSQGYGGGIWTRLHAGADC
jgi:hypothetical protein